MIKIGLSYYGSKIKNYIDWILQYDSFIQIVQLNHSKSIAKDLTNCTSLLLPGGSDINPELYGQNNSKGLSKNIDKERDNFESELLEIALSNKLPVLGICRGLQIANIHLGGTLHQDISNHRKTDSESSSDITHEINVDEESFLINLTNSKKGVVNSSHHQCVDKIADDFQASSYSIDKIVESLEWKDSSNKSPLLLVQWHPERMLDREENDFSKKILQWFINIQK